MLRFWLVQGRGGRGRANKEGMGAYKERWGGLLRRVGWRLMS